LAALRVFHRGREKERRSRVVEPSQFLQNFRTTVPEYERDLMQPRRRRVVACLRWFAVVAAKLLKRQAIGLKKK
jgi:hypothetical protein